ncbi:MAG TPA: 30S ribosomal protein S9 [Candidatus Brocadiia bacterium]|nr:30S ribosomal protein S9 [Candidatus Brocadiales bacterium]
MVEDSKYFWGTGRRKTSVARIRLMRGTGKIVVNAKELEEYFTRDRDRLSVRTPLKVTKTLGKYDVFANVEGGGLTGQAGAVALGVARALQKAEETAMESLRDNGLLTRDSRMKERKKYGRKGARKSFQWTKR